LVLNGQTGYVVAQGNVVGLASALLALAADETLLQHMSQTSRRRVENEFSFTARLRRIESLYEEILGVRPVSVVRDESAELVS
jgi:glycosyltransferase involved in cell wall biosynthesis